MKVKIKLFGLLVILTQCTSPQKQLLKVETFKIEDGWGYQITKKDKCIIYQDCIPAINTKAYFKTEKDAQKVGLFVVDKLRNNQSPSINLEELIELGVIKP